MAALVGRAVQRAAGAVGEDKPSNALIDKMESKMFFGTPESKRSNKEGNVPFGLHAKCRSRTQCQMLVQRRQFSQQQMMMIPPQFQNSIMFNQPSFMGPGPCGFQTGMEISMEPMMEDKSTVVPPTDLGTPPPMGRIRAASLDSSENSPRRSVTTFSLDPLT